MSKKIERDDVTGLDTTGHTWDGIRELDRPLPKWWLYVFYACIVWSIGYYVAYPAIPGITGYTKGVLDYSRRVEVAENLQEAKAGQRQFLDKIKQKPLAEIRSDTELLQFAIAGGKAAYADNCAACHGTGATGGPGFPSLADDEWLWGGKLEDIHLTLKHGVRFQPDPETRQSQMPRFGKDEVLDAKQVADVTEYVLSLGGAKHDSAAAERGKALYADNCAACHGETGEGDQAQGAPNLVDKIWLYAGSGEQIRAQIHSPKHGVMPAWAKRLDAETVKMLAIYIHSLGGGK